MQRLSSWRWLICTYLAYFIVFKEKGALTDGDGSVWRRRMSVFVVAGTTDTVVRSQGCSGDSESEGIHWKDVTKNEPRTWADDVVLPLLVCTSRCEYFVILACFCELRPNLAVHFSLSDSSSTAFDVHFPLSDCFPPLIYKPVFNSTLSLLSLTHSYFFPSTNPSTNLRQLRHNKPTQLPTKSKCRTLAISPTTSPPPSKILKPPLTTPLTMEKQAATGGNPQRRRYSLLWCQSLWSSLVRRWRDMAGKMSMMEGADIRMSLARVRGTSTGLKDTVENTTDIQDTIQIIKEFAQGRAAMRESIDITQAHTKEIGSIAQVLTEEIITTDLARTITGGAIDIIPVTRIHMIMAHTSIQAPTATKPNPILPTTTANTQDATASVQAFAIDNIQHPLLTTAPTNPTLPMDIHSIRIQATPAARLFIPTLHHQSTN